MRFIQFLLAAVVAFAIASCEGDSIVIPVTPDLCTDLLSASTGFSEQLIADAMSSYENEGGVSDCLPVVTIFFYSDEFSPGAFEPEPYWNFSVFNENDYTGPPVIDNHGDDPRLQTNADGFYFFEEDELSDSGYVIDNWQEDEGFNVFCGPQTYQFTPENDHNIVAVRLWCE